VKGEGDAAVEARVREEVIALCERFPIYPDLNEKG
jgi:glycine hydroxymethyltransferase